MSATVKKTRKKLMQREFAEAAAKKQAKEAANGAGKISKKLTDQAEDLMGRLAEMLKEFCEDHPIGMIIAVAILIVVLVLSGALTSCSALGGKGRGTGTLMDYGVNYDEAPLKADFTPDYDLIAQKAPGAKVCHIQRSRGYLQRNAFDLETIRKIEDTARAANPDIIIFVDNCYGEFTQTQEPCQVGADIAVGSLIKNPGGGIAPTGGYIVGRKDLVELCAYRLNAPGLGKELGCTLETPRDMYLGFYYAPGVVCEAIKTAIYAQCMLELLGKKPIPRYCEAHNDIVTCFDAGTAEALIGFCQGIQAASPVDSYAAPEPSPEPGYTDEVVMASGSFTQGSTIELSCDGPLRAPYTCYLQGGLNFAASRAGVLLAVQKAYFKE